MQHLDVVESCRNAASRRCRELQKSSIPTSRCSGLILGRFLSHFDMIIVGFKAQTQETKKKDYLEQILGVFEGEQAPFGWKDPRACSWRFF